MYRNSSLAFFFLAPLSTFADETDTSVSSLGETTVVAESSPFSLTNSTGFITEFQSSQLEKFSSSYHNIFENTAGGYSGNPVKGNFSLRGWSQDNTFGGVNFSTNTLISTEKHGIAQSAFTLRSFPPSLWDTSQVILKRGSHPAHPGPDGIGGNVSFFYNEPTNHWEGKAKLEYGERASVRSAFTQNIPILKDTLSIRLNYETESGNGSTENITLNDPHFGSFDTQRFRLQGLWNIDSSTQLKLTTEYHQVRGNQQSFIKNVAGFHYFDRKTDENTDSEFPADQWLTAITLNKRLSNDLEFHSTTGFSLFNHSQNTDLDFGADRDFTVHTFTNDLLISHNSYLTGGDQQLRWTVGSYLSFSDAELGFNGQGLAPGAGIPFSSDAKEKASSYSIYASADKQFKPKWHLHGSLRLQHDKEDIFTFRKIGSAPSGSSGDDVSETVLLPSIGIAWRPDDNSATGLKISRGYRPGGISHTPLLGTTNPYEAEYSWETEAYHRSNLSNSLHLQTSLFFTKLKDQQIPYTAPGGVPVIDSFLSNSGESQKYGIELELEWHPAENWNIRSSAAYTTTKFNQLTLDGVNRDGQAFPFAPKWTASTSISYNKGHGLFGHITFSWADTTYDRVEDPEITALEARSLLSSKIGWQTAQWKIYLYGENLLNDNFAYNRVRYAGLGANVRGKASDPISVGVGCEYKW